MALSELADADDWSDDAWSQVALPLLSGKAITGVISCYSLAANVARTDAAKRLVPFGPLLAAALDQAAEVVGDAVDSAAKPLRDSPFEYANRVGTSPAMRLIYEEAAQVARTSATTLIRGESGTGKDLVASAIHHNSDRSQQPMIKVNCAALPETLGLARAFALSPRMLLLDEPFGMLDSLTRIELQDVLLELWAHDRKTALMVTHDVDEAVFLSDRVVMMTSGPEAHVGEILRVPFERPRKRSELMECPAFYELREQLVGFLEEQGHRPAPTAAAAKPRRSTFWDLLRSYTAG